MTVNELLGESRIVALTQLSPFTIYHLPFLNWDYDLDMLSNRFGFLTFQEQTKLKCE